MRDDADARADAGRLRIHRHPGSALADIRQRTLPSRHAQPARAVQVVPLRVILALPVEHLHAVVLAVGHIDPAVLVAADVVHDVECAGIGARLAPGELQLAVWRILVHARVAVAVGDVDVALGRQRGVGAAVERIAAVHRRGLAGHADLQQELPFQRQPAHRVVAVVGAVDRVVRRDVHAVRPTEQTLAPGAQEVAVAVEHHHRVLAAREDVDVVLAVHADRGDLAVVPAVGQLAPVLDHLVAMLAGADDDCHDRLPYAALARACFGVCRSRNASTRRNCSFRWSGPRQSVSTSMPGSSFASSVRRRRRMRLVDARQQEGRHRAAAAELAADAEHELAVPHVPAERGERRIVELRALRLLLLRPLGEAFGEVFGMIRMQADRVLQHRGRHAVGCDLAQLQAEAAADAAAQRVEPAEAQMVHQREMVGGVGVPAVIGLDRGARAAGVALVHGDDAVTAGERARPVAPRSRRAAVRVVPHLGA